MKLEHNVYGSDACLESLISSCPVLEDLSLVRMVTDHLKVVRVCSQTLTRFNVDYMFGEDDDYVDDYEKQGSGVFVDAPRLEYVKWQDDMSESKVLTNPASLAKVNLVYVFNESDVADVVDLPRRNMVRNFFTSISRVSDMKISGSTVEFFCYNVEHDPWPKFRNLSCLKVTFTLLTLDMMTKLLKSFPNLKHLILVLDFDHPSEDNELIRLSSVPRCLVSSLECVEIKYFSGGPAKMEVARYFVENSAFLKKLVLHFRCSMLQEGFNILMDLLALPRRSSQCRIIVC
ncbi:unnamed protein product [Microthlaspi erraticum]|uniref:FBD domain-containing protein n=1 Tax=Microthlaspi erraticum TaxID=1685480 RepID=A0A6D2IH93_9BRAS|nr:unnamed protein product [Microthlaspi erraticum]